MDDWMRQAADDMELLARAARAEGVPPLLTEITTTGMDGSTLSKGNAYAMGFTVTDQPEIVDTPWRSFASSSLRTPGSEDSATRVRRPAAS